MKKPNRIFCAFLCAIMCFSLSVGAFAAEGGLSLTKHADTVSVAYYNSVKVITGFTEGETLGGAAAMFEDREHIQFVSLADRQTVTDSDAPVSTGILVCAVEGNAVRDMGLMAVFGDVNGDGKVNTSDARMALRHAAKLDTLGAVAAAAADCDCSGTVNTSDARMILRHAAKLHTIENPIGNVSGNSYPVSIHAYYTGGAVEAGTPLDISAVRVIAAFSDARNSVISSGFAVSPDNLTSYTPGEKTFTVTWQGLSAQFTVEFAQRTPVSFYTDSKVPDYMGFSGVGAIDTEFNLSYIAYIYPAPDDVADFVRFGAYMNYLAQCGFTCIRSTNDSNRIMAVYTKADDNAQVALIYDFSARRIYVAVYNHVEMSPGRA